MNRKDFLKSGILAGAATLVATVTLLLKTLLTIQ